MTIPDKFARKRPAPPQREGEGNYEKQETQERAGKEPRMDMIGSRMPFPYDAVSLLFLGIMRRGCACAMAVPFRRYAVRIVSPE